MLGALQILTLLIPKLILEVGNIILTLQDILRHHLFIYFLLFIYYLFIF